MTSTLAVASPVAGAITETFIRRHVEELLPGRTVAIARRTVDGGGWSPGVPLLETGANPTTSPGRWWRQARLRRFVRRHGVQTLLSEYLDVSLEWVDVAERLGLQLFAHAHGYDVSRRLRDARWRDAYRRLGSIAGIITMSHVSKERLLELGLDPALVHVVPYGVDVPDARPAPTAAQSSKVRCVAVGRFVAKKHPVGLVEAFVRAWRRDARLHLDFYGSGPLLGAATDLVNREGAGDAVTFHGARPHPQVLSAIRGADLFLQHSVVDEATGDEEGLPVAILEAMAAGRPIIATRHAGIPEAIDDGVSGVLVAERDLASTADHIVDLAADADRRHQLGSAAWARAREAFSWPREQQALLRLLSLT